MGAVKEEVRNALREVPGFQGPNGFDINRYRMALADLQKLAHEIDMHQFREECVGLAGSLFTAFVAVATDAAESEHRDVPWLLMHQLAWQLNNIDKSYNEAYGILRSLLSLKAPTPSEQLAIEQDMTQPDGRQGDRSRAIYEVTQVVGAIESLPHTVSVAAVADARGISVASDGRLLVTANAGMANPWVILFNETTPYWEYMYHYRYGHVGARVVESKATPGTYFATLVSSDTDPDYRFDIAIPPDVRNEMTGLQGSDSSSSEPYWIEVDAPTAARINPGDQVSASSTGQVIDVQGTTIYTDVDIFDGSPGDRYFSALRLAGRPGSDAAKREFRDG